MTQPRRGVRIALSPARKMVLELLHHACKVPSLPLSRVVNVATLVDARHCVQRPPSWMAVFMRAYALTAGRHSELRRAFLPWPRPHFYEHPETSCALLVEREWQGEQVVLGARIRTPEHRTLGELDDQLRYFRETPILDVNYFRQILRLGRLPGFIRRFTFWHSLYLSGFARAKRFGTFMISSLGNLGVEQHHPLTPLTTYFTFGPISPSGDVTLKIVYDHRVLDGRCVARCLQTLEEVLQTRL
ncbi:MAG TPA: hypothetical protein VMS17_29705, partial [Gemmataceae bacterium]|nr:hypothetical protein [Gemmataceae bacterium]